MMINNNCQLGVSKMVVDGELLPMPIEQLMRTKARVPLMTGVARREWAHKKRKCVSEIIHIITILLIQYCSHVLQLSRLYVKVVATGDGREGARHYRVRLSQRQ
jgi:hypothetical protein